MGRRRAAFPEGIAEEEQRYAQALREIRDLRGETQQALGQLLGWSVSMVSRFEAAAERPDQATHRRYCALAPTEELRERAVAAYEALPAPPARHAVPVRRSLEEWQGRALDGPGLYQFFAAAYPTCPVLRLFGDESKPLPVWAEPAPSEQWTDVEAPLGALDLSNPPPDPRRWRYWGGATLGASGTSSATWTTGIASFVRSAPASERIWTPGTSSPMTWLT
jgi:transcriptional regulator with XRE-family HTH domain